MESAPQSSASSERLLIQVTEHLRAINDVGRASRLIESLLAAFRRSGGVLSDLERAQLECLMRVLNDALMRPMKATRDLLDACAESHLPQGENGTWPV